MPDDLEFLQPLSKRISISQVQGYDKWKVTVHKLTTDNGMLMYNWLTQEEAQKQKELLIAYEKSHALVQKIVEIMNDYNKRKWHEMSSVTEKGLFERIAEAIRNTTLG